MSKTIEERAKEKGIKYFGWNDGWRNAYVEGYVQGATDQNKKLLDKACAWLQDHAQFTKRVRYGDSTLRVSVRRWKVPKNTRKYLTWMPTSWKRVPEKN